VARHKFKFPQPTKADLKLIDAAHDGHLDRCFEAIREGARVDAVSHRYATPLGEACWSNSTKIVRMLLEKGAELDLVDDSKTPLMEAAYRGNRELIELLLTAGADVFAKFEAAHNCFVDVPYMAQNKKLAVELRSLINQQRKIKDGTRLRLKDIAQQLNLDKDGKPREI